MLFLVETDEQKKRKKKSRWGGSEHEKIFIPGMPTILPSNLNKDQEAAYLRKCTSLNAISSLFYILKRKKI